MTQAQWQEFFQAMFGNGVVQGQLGSYVVTTTSGLGISVASGKATIQGFYARSDAAVALTCATADPTNPRIDRAVLHADLSVHTLTVILLTGTPAPSPAPPALTQTSTIWEISLYQVRVNATQTTLTGGSLTDERPFSGLVNRGGDTMTGALVAPAVTATSGLTFGPGNALLSQFTDANGTAALLSSRTSGAATYQQFTTWNGASSVSPLGLGSQALVGNYEGAILGDGGQFLKLGGQPTAGNLGAPVIVASAIDVNVTSTSLQNIISFTPAANGLYRLSGYFFHGNTGTTNCSFGYTWTDPHGTRPSGNFVFANSAAYQIILALGVPQNNMIATLPVTVYASSAATILITFQDASGTPSDFVHATIERLS